MMMAFCTVVGLLFSISGVGAQISFGDSSSSPSASMSTTITGPEVTIQDFCFSVGITHNKLKDIAIKLTFKSIQQTVGTDYEIVDQPENQLDDLEAASPVTFTTYSFHTPAAEMGFVDADPVTGYFYAASLLPLIGQSNVGTWTVTVEDKIVDMVSGQLSSFTPIFNDPAACGQTGAPSSAPSGSPSGPPAPGPPTTTVIPTCFSGTNTVQEQSKGVISMDSLSIGDYVRSSKGYSRVYGFLHLHRNVPADFLQVMYTTSTKGGVSSWIEVSAKHLLFSHGAPVAAGNVQVGDLLDGEEVACLVVTEIINIKRKGVYAPATESGDILVSGVQASNYVDILATSALDQHALSHAFVALRRTFCRMDSTACREESYTEDGYATWIKGFLRVSSMLNQSGPTIQYLATLLVWPMVVVSTIIFDQHSGINPAALAIAVVIGFAFYRRAHRSLKL